MKILEIDWRYQATKKVIDALSTSLKEIQVQTLPFDVDDALEQIERLLGIAFITVQTYITGTVSDINKNFEISPDVFLTLKDYNVVKECSNFIVGTEITEMELCYAVANYFKHHEGWHSWNLSENKRGKETIKSLEKAGITKADEYPCRKATKVLGISDSLDLQPLLSIIVDWRNKVIAEHK